jgi:hypothetical protein
MNSPNEMADEDATVQEVLNQLSAGSVQPETPQQRYMPPQMPPQQMFYNQQSIADNIIPIPKKFDNEQKSPQKMFEMNGEIRNVVLVVIVSILSQIVPIEQMVYKYISIQSLPYADFVVKGLFAGALYFVITKYFA